MSINVRQSGECGFTVTLKEGKSFPENFKELVNSWYQSNVPYLEIGYQKNGLNIDVSGTTAEVYFEFGYDTSYDIEPYSPATMWEPEEGGYVEFTDYYEPDQVESDFNDMLSAIGVSKEDIEEIEYDVDIDNEDRLQDRYNTEAASYDPRDDYDEDHVPCRYDYDD